MELGFEGVSDGLQRIAVGGAQVFDDRWDGAGAGACDQRFGGVGGFALLGAFELFLEFFLMREEALDFLFEFLER